MAFTSSTITHTWKNSDNSAASGAIKFQLDRRITNGGTSIVPASPISVNLDAQGSISVSLVSNSDTGTTPTDSQWRVFVEVAGASVEEYSVTVPVGPGTVDLGTLLPGTEQVQ